MRLPRKRRDIYEVVRKQRRKLLSGEKRTNRKLARLYRVAERDIERALAALVKRIRQAEAGGVTVSTAWLFQQTRYVWLLQAIRARMGEYAVEARGVVADAQAASIAAGVKSAGELADAAGIGTSFISLPVGQIERIALATSPGSPLYNLFEEFAPRAAATAQEIFFSGMAAGLNPRVIASKLRAELRMAAKRAELIARTESLRAYRMAQQENYRNNSHLISGSRVASSRDGRTCPICVARDGTFLPHGVDMPTHPGCRCVAVPVVIFAPVDRGTGEEWLDRQTEDFQRSLLGPGRYRLWREGMPLPAMVRETYDSTWGPGLQLVPLKELEKALRRKGNRAITMAKE